MVPSVGELRGICQKPNYRQVGNWMARYVSRDMALYLTWVLLHTRLRADSIALISLACGLFSALLVAIPAPGAFLAGALMLQLWYLLDHVDGQVARYYKEADLTGTFFDFMIHFFVHSAVTFGLGVRMFLHTGRLMWLLVGFVAALAMGGLSQFNDCKYKAFFSGLNQLRGKLLKMGRPASERARDVTPPPASEHWAKKVFVFLYKLTEIHVFMNLLGLAAIAQLFGLQGAAVFTWAYVVLLPFVLTARMVHTIRTHRIDQDFEQTFTIE